MQEYTGITGKNSKIISILFFILGLIGAIGLRSVLILSHFNFLASKISWYVAMLSLAFYYYRFYIEKKRRKIITSNNLRNKLINNELTELDNDKLRVLLDSLLISKFKANTLILFILTIVALFVEIILEILI